MRTGVASGDASPGGVAVLDADDLDAKWWGRGGGGQSRRTALLLKICDECDIIGISTTQHGPTFVLLAIESKQKVMTRFIFGAETWKLKNSIINQLIRALISITCVKLQRAYYALTLDLACVIEQSRLRWEVEGWLMTRSCAGDATGPLWIVEPAKRGRPSRFAAAWRSAQRRKKWRQP